MICMLFSHAARANPITRRACRRSEIPAGMSDLRGAARFSAYSRMSVESISTVPSSHTSDGAFTTGLIWRNCSKVLKTEIDRCSNGKPSNWSDTATRRTYGESSIPMSCTNPRGCRLTAALERITRRHITCRSYAYKHDTTPQVRRVDAYIPIPPTNPPQRVPTRYTEL